MKDSGGVDLKISADSSALSESMKKMQESFTALYRATVSVIVDGFWHWCMYWAFGIRDERMRIEESWKALILINKDEHEECKEEQ